MSFLTNFAQRRGCGVPGGRARAFTAKSASPPTPSIVGQSAALTGPAKELGPRHAHGRARRISIRSTRTAASMAASWC